MNKADLNRFFRHGHSCRGAGYLRFLLMFVVCFWNYGFPEPTGIVSDLCGFAAPAFFIFSGFFVLSDEAENRQKQIERKIKRTSLWLLCMIIFYVIVNIAFCMIKHVSVTFTLRTAFGFFAMNLWFLPIGSGIWFIHALLYAYIVIYIAERLHWMKYYKVVMILLFIFMLLSGEFAGLIDFNFLGYSYIPGNWLTRALPYLLFGMFMRENPEFFMEIRPRVNLMLFVLGGALAYGEIHLLSRMGGLIYMGHMVGYGIMAFALCNLALSLPKLPESHIAYYDTALSGLIYAFMDPAYYLIWFAIGESHYSIFIHFGGMIALVLSILLAFSLKESWLAKKCFSRRPIETF